MKSESATKMLKNEVCIIINLSFFQEKIVSSDESNIIKYESSKREMSVKF